MKIKFPKLFSSASEDHSRKTNKPHEDPFESVEMLLEEDDVIFRCKQVSDVELTSFLLKPQNITQLISYVVEPQDDPSLVPHDLQKQMLETAEKRVRTIVKNGNISTQSEIESKIQDEVQDLICERIQLKYPTVATDVLCSLVGKNHILPKIVENEDHISLFLSILAKDSPPPLCVKNFVRVFTAITQNSNLQQVLFSFFYRHNGSYIYHLMKFINYTPQLSEIIREILIFEPKKQTQSKKQDISSPVIDYNALKQHIISHVIRSLNDSHNIEMVSPVIISLLKIVRPSPVVEPIFQYDSVRIILNAIRDAVRDTQHFESLLQLLTSLIARTVKDDDCISLIVEQFSYFEHMLREPPVTLHPIELTTGRLKYPLGSFRLAIIDFFEFIFDILQELCTKHPHAHIRQKLIDCNILPTLFDLFFQYEHANILHNLVTNIVNKILESQSSSEYNYFVKVLMEDCDILSRLIEYYRINKKLVDSHRLSLSSFGHMTKIAQLILDTTHLDEEELTERFPGWQEYDQFLKDRHFIETVYRHGGDIPLPAEYQTDSDESDDEFGLHHGSGSIDINPTNSDEDDAFDDDEFDSSVVEDESTSASVPSFAQLRPRTPAAPIQKSRAPDNTTHQDERAEFREPSQEISVNGTGDGLDISEDVLPTKSDNTGEVDWFLNEK